MFSYKFKFAQILLLSSFSSLSFLQAQDKNWTLQQCIEHTLQNDLSIKEIALNEQFQQQEITRAYGNLLPNASLYADHQYNFGSVIDPTTNSRVSSDIQANSIGFSSKVELFNWSNFVQIKLAKLQKSKAELDTEIKKNELIIKIVQAFNQVQFDQEQLTLIASQIENTKANQQRINTEVELGNKAKSDLYEISAQLKQEEQLLVNAQNALTISKTRLQNILQIREEINFIETEIASPQLWEQNIESLYEKGLEVRPEIKSAQIQTEIAQKNILQKRSNYLPTINGNYSLSSFYVDTETSAFRDQIKNNKNHFIGLSIDIPIFNRLQTKTSVQQAKIDFERANLQLEQQKQAYFNALREAFTQTQNSFINWQAAESNLEAQQVSFEKTEEKFRQGMIDSYSYFAAKNNLLSAQTAVLQAKYTYHYESILLQWYTTNRIEF